MLFIVARYNEDVSWTKNLKNVFICNKGERLEEDYNQIMMDNVGREGHTYYKYIIDNYDNLDDYIVFLQGNPFDHSPNLFHIIELLNNNLGFTFLSETLLITNLNAQRLTYEQCSEIENTYNKIFTNNLLNPTIFFGSGAQFAVTKNNILKQSKEFYSKIVDMLQYDINPIEGHHIERFHYHIFMGTENKLDNNDFNDLMLWIEHTTIFRIFYMSDGVKFNS